MKTNTFQTYSRLSTGKLQKVFRYAGKNAERDARNFAKENKLIVRRGFTLLELIITVGGLVTIFVLFVACLQTCSGGGSHGSYREFMNKTNAEWNRAAQQEKVADEMRRANDLKERELRILEEKKFK
jgi:hypothetical protein